MVHKRNAYNSVGFNTVPVDINLNTLNTDLEEFLKTISKENIKAFFITNVLGFSSN